MTFNDRLRKEANNPNITDAEIESVLNEHSIVFLPTQDLYADIRNAVDQFLHFKIDFSNVGSVNNNYDTLETIKNNNDPISLMACYTVLFMLRKSLRQKFGINDLDMIFQKNTFAPLSPDADVRIAKELLTALQQITGDFENKLSKNDLFTGVHMPCEFGIIPFTRKDTSAYAYFNKQDKPYMHQVLECIIAYKDRCEAVEICDYKALREFYEDDKSVKVVYINLVNAIGALSAYRLIYPYLELARKGLIKIVMTAAIWNKMTYAIAPFVNQETFNKKYGIICNAVYSDWFLNAYIKPDVIVCQRYTQKQQFVLFNDIKSQMKRFYFSDIRFINDNDDLVTEMPEYNTNYNAYVKVKDEYIKQISYFNDLTVSTDFLKKKTQDIVKDKRITVIPNLLDLEHYKLLQKNPKDDLPDFSKEFMIAYHGGSSHGQDIEAIKDVFLELIKWDNVKFALFGFIPDLFKTFPKDRIYYQPVVNFSYDKYPRILNGNGVIRKDIALIPLVENNFNKAKSNLKLIEYSALGIPSICSLFNDSPYSDGHTNVTMKIPEILDRIH